MIIVNLGFVTVLVANDTAEHRIVARTGVAVRTGIPLVFVLATVNRKIHGIMVPGRR